MTSLVNFLKDASLDNFYRGSTVPVVPTTSLNRAFRYHRPLITDVNNGTVDILELYNPEDEQAYMDNKIFVDMTQKLQTMLTSNRNPDHDNPQLYVIGEVCANELKGDKSNKDMSDETIASFLKGPQANNSAVFRYILPIKRVQDRTITRVNLSYARLQRSSFAKVPWKFICYGLINGAVKIIDAEKNNIYLTLPTKNVNWDVICIAMSPRTKRICVGIASKENNDTNHICLYDTISGTEVKTSQNILMHNTAFPVEKKKAIRSVVFIDSLEIVVSGDDNGDIILWNYETLQIINHIKLNEQNIDRGSYVQVASVVFYMSLNQLHVFAGCWVTTKDNHRTGALFRIIIPKNGLTGDGTIEKKKLNEQVTSLAIKDNTIYVATNTTDSDLYGKVYYTNFRNDWSQNLKISFQTLDDINSIALSKENNSLAIGTEKSGVYIYDTVTTTTFKATRTDNNDSAVNGVIFDNDGNLFSVDTGGFLSKTEKGARQMQNLDSARKNITCMAFMEIPHSEEVKSFDSNINPSFSEYEIDYSQITSARQKNVLQHKIGLTVSIKNIGVTCGKPFSFHKWADDEKILLSQFISAYNNGDGDVNNLMLQYINSVRSPNIQTLKTWFKAHYNFWESKWINIIKKKKRDVNQWTNTFDIALLSDHKFSSLSVFVLYGTTIHDQIDTEDDYRDRSTEDSDVTSVYPNTDLLLPVPFITNRTRGTISWNGVKDYFKINGPQQDRSIKGSHEKHWCTRTEEKKGVSNIYRLLVHTNGGQGIEHVSLSSVLGSGAHTGAALDTLQNKTGIVAGFSTSSENIKLLDKYEKGLPGIVDILGTQLAETKIEGKKPRRSIIAVEFPVYYFGKKIENMYIYSRIDAISKNFLDNEGYAIWEYKTRWGEQIINDASGADEMHVRQTAFYCFCANNMLPDDQKIQNFYIRYIKMLNDTSYENTQMEIHTFRYRYAHDPSNTESWNAETHYKFQEKIDAI